MIAKWCVVMWEGISQIPSIRLRQLALTAGVAAFGLVNISPIIAQSPPPTQTPSPSIVSAPVFKYEVASIKPDKAGGVAQRVGFLYTPDGLFAKNITLQLLIRDAYRVADYQIDGGPKWLDSETFDIEARMDGPSYEELQKLRADERWVQRQRMLQALLAERCKLILHRQSKEGSVYELRVVKSGPKLQESNPEEIKQYEGAHNDTARHAPVRMTVEPGQMTFRACSLTPLARLLSEQLGRPVLDRTGLNGKYDFNLQWNRDEDQLRVLTGAEPGGQGSDNPSPPQSPGPSIFTALQEQLGLKLVPAKGPVETLVIEHIEKPSEN